MDRHEQDMGPSSALSEEAMKQQLGNMFEQLSHDIPLMLFAAKGEDDVFVQATRETVRTFRSITDRIQFREYDLDHEMAVRYKVDSAPTLLVAPDRYDIRWMGAPLGEEVKTFFETLLLVGNGKSSLGDQAVKVLGKIDEPRHVKVFVSATCPYCPQQAVNAIKAAIEKPKMISVEIVDIQCKPEIASKYHAQSVPQTFADDILIGQGAQSEEVFAVSLEKMEPTTIFIPDVDAEQVETDILIVGGGPAGLTAGIYAVRSGLTAAVVERGALGGQIATTPVVENYPGFTQVGGKALVDIMVSHALQYVQIFQGEEVLEINQGNPMAVVTSRRRFRTKALLLATGAVHRKLDVAGENQFAGRGVSYCSTCDGPLFKGKDVVLIGGGDSAVTEALHLHHMGVNVTLIHRRETLRAQEFLVRQLENSGIPLRWNSEIKEIRGGAGVESVTVYNRKTNKDETVPTAGVFIAVGYAPSTELAVKAGVELTPEGYIRRDERHRTNIPGIYSAGDVEGGYKQIVTAAGQGSEAAMAIFEDMINPYWKSSPEGKS
jgi:thioredoxin reductase (NADPH)